MQVGKRVAGVANIKGDQNVAKIDPDRLLTGLKPLRSVGVGGPGVVRLARLPGRSR